MAPPSSNPPSWQPAETRGGPTPAASPIPSAQAWANLAYGRLEPGLTIGGCVVESVLGRGGMGVVLRARAGGPTGPAVALKVMLEVDRASSSFERFAREVEAVRTLDHPGVVRVLSAEPRAQIPWLAMELVEGVTLERVFADPKRSLAERLELLVQVCDAVQHAHQRGILHRDLKPSNVLVDAQGRAKVTDFGLARNVGRATRLTETGTLMGTPAYVSPESIKGEDTGVPADVWALGVMLYEALAGCRPFHGGSPLELVRRILEETPLAPSQVSPHVTKAHDRVVLRALAKEPTQRYASVGELAREIDALRREMKAPRARARRERRRPSLVVGVGSGALALAGIAVAVVSKQSSPAPTVVAPPPVTEAPPPPVVHPFPPVMEAPPPPPPPVDPLLVPLTEAGQALAAFEADRAERAADRALLLAPDSIEALFLRGQARDLRLDPGAWADLRTVAGSDEPTLAYQAWLLLAASDVQNAYAHLTEATRVAPRRPEAFVARGLLELYGGRGKDGSPTCRGDIEKAVELAPDSVPALTAQGVLFWDDALRTEGLSEERRDALYEDAAQCYRRALELDPTAAETLSVRALLHRNRGGGDPAKQFADHAAALALFETQRDRALYFVEQARSARARGDLATAVAFAQRARGENRRHPLAVQELNVVGCMQWVDAIARPGDLSPADEDRLLAFLKDGPRSTLHTVSSKLREVRLWQARVYLAPWSKRSVETARVDIDKVLVDHPDDADALALRARARLEQGQAEGALEDALRALELAPRDSLAATEALAARDEARRQLGR